MIFTAVRAKKLKLYNEVGILLNCTLYIAHCTLNIASWLYFAMRLRILLAL